MRMIATAIALLAALTPALAVQQLTETAPLLSGPVLSFDGTPWIADSTHPAAYLVGLTKIAGMAEAEAAVIAARPGAPREGKGGVAQSLDAAQWRGKRVKLTARLKTQNVTEVQVVMDIVAGAAPRQTTQTMATRALSGTRDWRAQEIVMEVPADATDIVFGFYLRGTQGAAFGDSFKLEAVGRDVPLTRASGWNATYSAPGMVRSLSIDAVQNGGLNGQ